jgi:hypothetical protein
VNNGKPKHIIPVGDFNCPDIDWNNMTINPKAAEKEVQKKLIDLSTEFNHQSTRHTNQRRQTHILVISLSILSQFALEYRFYDGISNNYIMVGQSWYVC